MSAALPAPEILQQRLCDQQEQLYAAIGADNYEKEKAANIREFLASVRPMRDSADVECGERYQSGRGACEQMALALEYDKRAPSPAECLDALAFLQLVEPTHDEHCFGHVGEGETCGYYAILNFIEKTLEGYLNVPRTPDDSAEEDES